jgi:tRNA nucleotidyltransferase (CCA-adding enzyme)
MNLGDDIDREVADILGSSVYLVGGSVRDILLGKEPEDYDFCTALSPSEVESRVKATGKLVRTYGKLFGTICFECQGQQVEVTTFRVEKYDYKSRKPEVKFVRDIGKDLRRRDFTMNAMAMRGNRLIDPFGGQGDIHDRVIRIIGNGSIRIKEDPLRMLRAARFAAQLNFTVDPEFMNCMRKNASAIMLVSRQLWTKELDKLLMTEHPQAGLKVLAESGLLKFMLPELSIQIGYDQHSPYHDLSLWEHTVSTVVASPREVNLRWAAFLHDVGKPFTRTEKNEHQSNYLLHDMVGSYIAEGIGARFKWPNARTQLVADTIYNHLDKDSPIREADNLSKTKLPMV